MRYLAYLIQQEPVKILREGLDVAIVGKPNVGKSSLLKFTHETGKSDSYK